MEIVKVASTNIRRAWNAMLPTSSGSKLTRKNKRYRDSPNNPTHKLTVADNYET